MRLQNEKLWIIVIQNKVVTALKNWAFLFAPLSRRECVVLIRIGHDLMTLHKSKSSNTWLLKHTRHNLQAISGMRTGQSKRTFKACRHVLKLKQNIMNYVFLLFCVHWHWKLSLTFHPDTANLKNVQMTVILTSLGHKILKLYMVSKDIKKKKFIIIPSSYFSRPLQWWWYIH